MKIRKEIVILLLIYKLYPSKLLEKTHDNPMRKPRELSEKSIAGLRGVKRELKANENHRTTNKRRPLNKERTQAPRLHSSRSNQSITQYPSEQSHARKLGFKDMISGQNSKLEGLERKIMLIKNDIKIEKLDLDNVKKKVYKNMEGLETAFKEYKEQINDAAASFDDTIIKDADNMQRESAMKRQEDILTEMENQERYEDLKGKVNVLDIKEGLEKLGSEGTSGAKVRRNLGDKPKAKEIMDKIKAEEGMIRQLIAEKKRLVQGIGNMKKELGNQHGSN